MHAHVSQSNASCLTRKNCCLHRVGIALPVVGRTAYVCQLANPRPVLDSKNNDNFVRKLWLITSKKRRSFHVFKAVVLRGISVLNVIK